MTRPIFRLAALAAIVLVVGCASHLSAKDDPKARAKREVEPTTLPTTQPLSQNPLDYVELQQGDLPIVLSAPHGGLMKVPEVPPRQGAGLERGPGKYVTGTDGNTNLLAHAVAEAIEKKTGHKVSFVIAKFKRSYIDANRPPELSYEVPAAKPFYDAYHDHLAEYVHGVNKQFGRGLLVDIHGQGSRADTIFRGTKNGMTVAALIKNFGPTAHNGPKSLIGLMDAHGLKVHPLDGGNEQAGFTGGYIVQHYGSNNPDGIDAIQLEHGIDYREKSKIADAADKLSDAIIDYYKLYLESPKQR